jgi:hypothetical protein
MTIITHPHRADALPQLGGRDVPGGSVLYTCSGMNEHGKKCGKLMFIWMPPPGLGAGGYAQGDHVVEMGPHGRIEVKCRRCKTLNYIPLGADQE